MERRKGRVAFVLGIHGSGQCTKHVCIITERSDNTTCETESCLNEVFIILIAHGIPEACNRCRILGTELAEIRT